MGMAKQKTQRRTFFSFLSTVRTLVWLYSASMRCLKTSIAARDSDRHRFHSLDMTCRSPKSTGLDSPGIRPGCLGLGHRPSGEVSTLKCSGKRPLFKLFSTSWAVANSDLRIESVLFICVEHDCSARSNAFILMGVEVSREVQKHGIRNQRENSREH
jgi:hypothetical protein